MCMPKVYNLPLATGKQPDKSTTCLCPLSATDTACGLQLFGFPNGFIHLCNGLFPLYY